MNNDRALRQRLAIALGMTLSDGSPIVEGGPKCPPDRKIKAALKAAGWMVTRLSNAQRSDLRDDAGVDRRYISDDMALPAKIRDLLSQPSGVSDGDGPITLEEHLLISVEV